MSLDALAELFTTAPQATGPEPTAAELERQFTPKEWAALQRRPNLLAALRLAFEFGQQRRRGIIPQHYTEPINCEACGPVWAWPGAPARALACPWCANRADGLPIPRPSPSAGGRPDFAPMTDNDL